MSKPRREPPPTLVNLATLKAQLSRYVRIVRAGDEVVVLDRDTPVAKLVPYREPKPFKLTIRKPLLEPASLAGLRFPAVRGKKVDSLSALLEERRRR